MCKTLEKGLRILEILNDNGFEAYIVGGFVRDRILRRDSNDIDICTSATPRDIINLFPNCSSNNYGSVNIMYKNTYFDITTFRRDIKYKDNRSPVKVKYIKNIKRDLLRRDFTINTFLMDSNENIIDYLCYLEDLDNKIIRVVGNPKYKLKEDVLRILRAIRFATVLDFDIEENTKKYIKKYAYLLKNLSYQRKKEELDKIFASVNNKKGIDLICDLGLYPYLELGNFCDVVAVNDLMGLWAQIDSPYTFNKNELHTIGLIRELMDKDYSDLYNIYKYGLYVASTVWSIKGLDVKELNRIYSEISIKSRRDMCINGKDIITILGIEPSSYVNDIIEKIEKEIVYGRLENNYDILIKYLRDNYSQR